MCLFLRKRVLLDSIKVCLGSFFKLQQTTHMSFKKKGLFRGKFGGKIAQNSPLGVFSCRGEIVIIGYVLKTSGHAGVQH